MNTPGPGTSNVAVVFCPSSERHREDTLAAQVFAFSISPGSCNFCDLSVQEVVQIMWKVPYISSSFHV